MSNDLHGLPPPPPAPTLIARPPRAGPAALLLLTAPLWGVCLNDEAPTDPGRPSASPIPATAPAANPAVTAETAAPTPDAAQAVTATTATTQGGALSEAERADGCVYALAELRGVSNPSLARSAAGNRARAAMKARLQTLQDGLPAELQDSFQRWRAQARVELPELLALGRRRWQAKARVRLEGLSPAVQAALLGTPPDTP